MKKKSCTKRIIAIATAIIITIASIFVYINIKPVSVDYGMSELYTQQDMDSAIELIKESIDSRKGCKLYSLSYAGDGWSSKELDYCNSLERSEELFTECIVFDSCFRSPIFGGGGWNANSLYYWNWYLARTDDGPWQLVSWGYA